MALVKIKRDVYTLYLTLQFFRYKKRRNYAKCYALVAQIEFLQSHISYKVAAGLYSLLRNKYELNQCGPNGPYVTAVIKRFTESGRRFLQNDMLVLKPYISDREKGVLMIKYSEVINAIPFLFDIHRIQQRYHLVLEPSTESPFQPFNAFIPTDSCVFIESISKRESEVHRKHGFIPVPLNSGDWVNRRNFFADYTVPRKYDFCIISNFVPFKRYPFLLSALQKHWKGPLRMAIVASGYVGEGRKWIEEQLQKYGQSLNAEIIMDVPPAAVNAVLNQSHCHLMCSLREGPAKANYESMITGTPVVIHKDHVGFANWKFKKPMVTNYTNEKNLVDAIRQSAKASKKEVAMLANALIGSERATEVLNREIKSAVINNGEVWTTDIFEKVNNIHTFYANPADVESCVADYHYLQSCANSFFSYNADEAIELFRSNGQKPEDDIQTAKSA